MSTDTPCQFCGGKADRRAICPSRTSSARYPNGKRHEPATEPPDTFPRGW